MLESGGGGGVALPLSDAEGKNGFLLVSHDSQGAERLNVQFGSNWTFAERGRVLELHKL